MKEHIDLPGWVFDPSPPSGARTGGNVAEYAFRPDVNTLVREVLQNVLDNARAGGGNVSVAFKLVHLTGSDLSSFLDALRWKDLEPHMRAAGQEIPGRRFALARERLDSDASLQLLLVEDANTTGLTGDESGDGSNFAQLCRDTLYSNKASETAGGSFGLGKAVLWLFSELSTVLFSSRLEVDPKGGRSPRFIGRTELPWHKIDSKAFAGPGWLGEVSVVDAGQMAKSVWAPDSERIASQLRLERSTTPGTSILVVGFRNPADEDQDLESTAHDIIHAVGRNFWPSVIGGRLKVSVTVIDTSKKAQKRWEREMGEGDLNPAYAKCLAAYNDMRAGSTLDSAGDIAEVSIPVQIPARSDASQPQKVAEASLVVRLAEDDEPEGANEVAFFRGTGMVVKYERFDRLSLSQRPFHGILVCGKARRLAGESDTALDEFLRAAEPPEHKGWEVTPRLKETYKPGYKRLLSDIDAKVKEALRDLVSEKPPSGTDGPRLLVRLFPVGGNKIGEGREKFKVKDLSARLEQGTWAFSGTIIAVRDSPGPWSAQIDLRFRGEDPTDTVSAVVRKLKAYSTPASKVPSVSIDSGIAMVSVPAGVTKLRFEGLTDPSRYSIDPRRATVFADVRCAYDEGQGV